VRSVFFSYLFSFPFCRDMFFKLTDEKWSECLSCFALDESDDDDDDDDDDAINIYVAAVIELKACIRIRTRCVNIADRWNRVIEEIARHFNRIGLISDYTNMLDASTTCLSFLGVAHHIYEGNNIRHGEKE
jgi:hypothetical protein